MTDSLYSRLKDYENSDFYPFHMPGHKRNLEEGVMPAWYSMDITEIDGFDNLHQPQEILLKSQQKAAHLYQAEETFFLVNGSTSGILSALSAVAGKGKKVLISRNSHMSVYHGAMINDISLEYLYPRVMDEYDIAEGIQGPEVAEYIKDREDIGAVLITSPTYEGVISDIESIAQAVHKQGIPLIVDQAHGAHFGFHSGYPENAVKQGADIVIHSVHKTLPAPTQTALLHVNGNLVNRKFLKRYLRIFQSSSPSYPLMAGIDFCINKMQEEGRERLEALRQMRSDFGEKVSRCKYIYLCEVDDPSRVVISVKGTSLTGHRLADILRRQYHLEMEMASESYVVAIFTIMDTSAGINRLAEALTEIDCNIENKKQEFHQGLFYQSHALETIVGIKEAWEGLSEEIPLNMAEGRTAAEFIFLYPPGIPLVVPGERLDGEMLEIISKYLREGVTIYGLTLTGEICILK